jgi:hypothetical protein
MSTTVGDLWPEDLRVPDETAPALLMRQQAEFLGVRTNGRVEADVITRPLDHDELAHHFRLKATALGGYGHSLFIVTHRKARPYPVVVEQVLREDTGKTGPLLMCESEADFKQLLRQLFASVETRKAVDALLAA